jgi:SagB-type dehydrogenase family enzyme
MSSLDSIGPQFQRQTSYSRHAMPTGPSWAREAPPYKEYEAPLQWIELPAPCTSGGPGLWETIAARRTIRDFADTPMALATLSQLLWAVQGLTHGGRFRASASAGALYPNETYLLLNRVTDCPPGIGHYDPRSHRLALLREGDFGAQGAAACLRQGFVAQAPVTFAWAAVVERCAQKYRDRAYRYINLDAGHLGGQLQLAATALGLGSVNIGAFLDDEVASLFGLDGEYEIPVYLTSVGTPRT